MMIFKPLNPGTGALLRAFSSALRDCETISIVADGETGIVTMKVGNVPVARYKDAYEAIRVLLPEYAKELI